MIPDGRALVSSISPTSSSAEAPMTTAENTNQSGNHGASHSSRQSTSRVSPTIEKPMMSRVPSMEVGGWGSGWKDGLSGGDGGEPSELALAGGERLAGDEQ